MMVQTRSLRSLTEKEEGINDAKSYQENEKPAASPHENIPVVTSSSDASPSPIASTTKPGFLFKGARFESYKDMVQAKREYNNEMLRKSGLLDASAKFRQDVSHTTTSGSKKATQRGLRADRKRKEIEAPLLRRKSSRIAGVEADGVYIEDERSGGRVVIGGMQRGADGAMANSNSNLYSSEKVAVEADKDQFYNRRVNDGSDLSIQDAVELCGHKWVKDDSVGMANQFVGVALTRMNKDSTKLNTSAKRKVGKSNASLASQVEGLSVDDESCVAKVVPERIYSVSFHPSSHKLIATAGDKKGFVGLWDVDAVSTAEGSDTNGVYLFKPHSGAVNNLEWNKSGKNLLSQSYDGTIRLFDIHKQVFIEAFAAYDDSMEYKDHLGYGMDEGNKFYTQYACYDHRNEDCLFLSTSVGGVAHFDLRNKKKTFDMALGDKKINTLR